MVRVVKNEEFGKTVRRHRERLSPEAVGLPGGGRRRAPGLRREELAMTAGISVDYLTRLEQGRATSPSPQVVESLTRALRLPDADRERLFLLAGYTAPGVGLIRTRIAPSVARMLDRLAGTPVVVYDAAWNLLIANPAYDALMGDTSVLTCWERNALWRNIHGPASRARQSAQEHDAQIERLVADLRMTAVRYPADPALRDLIDELTSSSARFAELWESADDAPAPDAARHKVIAHPTVGPITVDCDTLVVAGDDLRIMIYTAEPDTADAEKLDLAIVLGTQALALRGP